MKNFEEPELKVLGFGIPNIASAETYTTSDVGPGNNENDMGWA